MESEDEDVDNEEYMLRWVVSRWWRELKKSNKDCQ
jgi:hypothetical protein